MKWTKHTIFTIPKLPFLIMVPVSISLSLFCSWLVSKDAPLPEVHLEDTILVEDIVPAHVRYDGLFYRNGHFFAASEEGFFFEFQSDGIIRTLYAPNEGADVWSDGIYIRIGAEDYHYDWDGSFLGREPWKKSYQSLQPTCWVEGVTYTVENKPFHSRVYRCTQEEKTLVLEKDTLPRSVEKFYGPICLILIFLTYAVVIFAFRKKLFP